MYPQKPFLFALLLMLIACKGDVIGDVVPDPDPPKESSPDPGSTLLDTIIGTYTGTSTRISHRPNMLWDSVGNPLGYVTEIDTSISADTIRIIKGSSSSAFMIFSDTPQGCVNSWQETEIELDESDTYELKEGHHGYYSKVSTITIDPEAGILATGYESSYYDGTSPPSSYSCKFAGAKQ